MSKFIKRTGQTPKKFNIIKWKGWWNSPENPPLPHLLQLGMGEQEASFTAFGYGSYQIVWPNQNLENLDENWKHKPYVKELELVSASTELSPRWVLLLQIRQLFWYDQTQLVWVMHVIKHTFWSVKWKCQFILCQYLLWEPKIYKQHMNSHLDHTLMLHFHNPVCTTRRNWHNLLLRFYKIRIYFN